MPSRLLASRGSSPDPLSQSTGPTISSTPQTKRSPKKRRTTVISTPSKVTTTTTSSPWRFRVVVEAERDVDEDDDVDVTLSRGRKTQTRTTTTKIPLRGLSPEPVRTGREKKKTTPARARAGSRSPSKTATRKSPTAKKTPAPKKTPRARKKATPVIPVEDSHDEGNEEETPVPQVQQEAEKSAETSKRSLRKSRSPVKSRVASARTTRRNNAVAGPSHTAAVAEEEESVSSNRSVLSRVDPNTLLSPTPPVPESSKCPPRRSTRNISSIPSPSPALVELDTEDEEASIEQSEGFSLISAHSLLPDLRDSSSRHHQTLPTQDKEEEEEEDDTDVDMALPDFTYIDTGASYTPRAAKKQGLPIEPPEEELFDGQEVGIESFYGAPIPPGLFRSSPPPEFSREISSRDMITPHIPGTEKTPQLPPRLPDGDSKKKRTRETPGLDSILRAGEDLRSSMGTDSSPGMEMRSERFGGALDNDDEDQIMLVEEGSPSVRVRKEGGFNGEAIKYPHIEEIASTKAVTGIASPSVSEQSTKHVDRKGKGKAKAAEKRRRPEVDDAEWGQTKNAKITRLNHSPAKSPSKSVRFQPGERTRMLEDIWALEREEVRKQAEEAGAITIDGSPSRTVMLQEKWQEEREEVKRQAQDAGAITIDTTIWEQAGTDESSLSLAGQDTKAFEESIYNRIKLDEEAVPEKLFPASAMKKSRTGPSSSAGSSSSTGRKYGIGSSTIGIRGESVSSLSSPPPTAPTTMYQPSTREQAMAQVSASTAVTRPTTATSNASNTPNMLPPDLIQLSPPASNPESSGWTQNHWKLLETILHSRKTVPPASWKRRLLVSIDDPSKLSTDGLLEDDDVEIVQSREGMWLRLNTRETYAVARFLRKKQVKTEGWEEKVVAGKVGAIVLAAVRRRRREERRVGKELRA
ncbi:hypothetical protein L873DRAFT_1835951 [Choiromyces venosus 120613-1]|uniref:Uncharacterized protein n=1 Tax=Choiromyces venosus 120613-1 TaxID=1336337 RepID=A0A3N4JMK0_9PEZI|nr:hypothetical protein L873DRAFT_1835951 [Choiromyces venosus 120613-1]